MTRQVVWVSGAEAHSILACRGRQVPPDAFSPRLRTIFATLEQGAFAVALAPSLDGTETDAASGYPTAGNAAAFHRAMVVSPQGGHVAPRAVVPADAVACIPPPLLMHYAAAAAGGDGSRAYSPSLRSWTGPDPLSRVVVSMWKGKNRCVE